MLIIVRAELQPNRTGAIIGIMQPSVGQPVMRTAAHWYKVASESLEDTRYDVYIQSITPHVYRCACPRFIGTGHCKHGHVALAAERYIRTTHRQAYNKEKGRQKLHLAAARRAISTKDARNSAA